MTHVPFVSVFTAMTATLPAQLQSPPSPRVIPRPL